MIPNSMGLGHFENQNGNENRQSSYLANAIKYKANTSIAHSAIANPKLLV